MIVEVPRHLSWSQASSLVGSFCPAQYFYGRVLGKEEIPAWASLGGSAVHTATEKWDLSLLTEGNYDTSFPYLAELFNSALDAEIDKLRDSSFPKSEWRASGRPSKDFPQKENEDWWRAKGPDMVFAWTTWRSTSPWEIATLTDPETELPVLGVEVPFKAEIAGEPVIGYIDRVFVRQTPDGPEFLAVDLKSGSMEPKGAGQLATYRIGTLQKYGVDVKWGAYWMARTGLSTTFYDLPATWPQERVDFIYREARATQMRGGFMHRPSNLCGGCPLRAYCPEGSGEKAAKTPQPWDVSEVRIAAPVASSRPMSNNDSGTTTKESAK